MLFRTVLGSLACARWTEIYRLPLRMAYLLDFCSPPSLFIRWYSLMLGHPCKRRRRLWTLLAMCLHLVFLDCFFYCLSLRRPRVLELLGSSQQHGLRIISVLDLFIFFILFLLVNLARTNPLQSFFMIWVHSLGYLLFLIFHLHLKFQLLPEYFWFCGLLLSAANCSLYYFGINHLVSWRWAWGPPPWSLKHGCFFSRQWRALPLRLSV